MKARGEEKIEGKEMNKESQVAGKERKKKRMSSGCANFLPGTSWN